MKKIFLALAIAILVLTGCSTQKEIEKQPEEVSVPVEPEFKDYDPALLGKWDRDDDLGGYIIFNGDGTGFLQDTGEAEVLNFTYKANGTIAKIKPDNMEEINIEYSFEEDELLVFVNKGLIRYFKQEEGTD